MAFKSHPYYDTSSEDDWLSLRPSDWTELEPGPFKILYDRVVAEKQRLCEIALDRIRLHAGSDFLAETPHPSLKDFSYCPAGDLAFSVYVEYAFLPRPNENSPENDFWWAIILCEPPGPFPGAGPVYVVTDVGWSIG